MDRNKKLKSELHQEDIDIKDDSTYEEVPEEELADDFDDVHCADLCGIFVQFVKKGDDLLLVRDGHIKSAEVGIFLYDFHKVIDVAYLKVYIFGVDILRFELFIEISDGKRMSQRIAY